MKILISYRGIPGDGKGWATGDLLVSVFRQLGHDVHVYGHYYENTADLLPNAIRHEDLYKYSYDLVIYLEMNDGNAQYLELKYINAKRRAYWNFDVSYYPEHIKALCNYMRFDHIFYANYLYDKFFEEIAPSTWLPYAFCPDRHIPNNWPKRDKKISIVGSLWNSRKKIVDELKKAEIPLNVVTGVFRNDYIRELASTHVVINHNQNQGRGLLVMRIFEALATKSCLITNDGDNVEYCLNPGSECFVYKDINELIDICRFLNKDIGEANWVADNGHKRGMHEHTYLERAKKILEICGG